MSEPLPLRKPGVWASRQLCEHFLVTGKAVPMWYPPYDPDDYDYVGGPRSPKRVFCDSLSVLSQRIIGGASGNKCAAAVLRACLNRRPKRGRRF